MRRIHRETFYQFDCRVMPLRGGPAMTIRL
jgi:hypothetical protein